MSATASIDHAAGDNAADARVAAITFTGSTATGRKIHAAVEFVIHVRPSCRE